jgi:hypothetical protein
MKLNELNTPNNRTSQILTEGYQDLTETQKIYLNRWERELWPLLEEYTKLAEAELTADQIQDIFKGAEERAMAGGNNKTIAGKVGSGVAAAAKLPVDIAKKVDAKINELGRLAQNAGPVKNADAKFEELKKKISAENSDSKIVQGIQKVSDWAKENPGKASIAVGILTTIAAFAGGPAGGAAAGLILRASKDLLQGEKLSTAVGKSVKTAAYGALAGLAIQGLTDGMVDNIATGSEAEANAMLDSFEKANFDAAVSDAAAEAGLDAGVLDGAMNYSSSGNINGFTYNYNFTMTPEQVAEYKQLFNATTNVKVFSPEYYEAAGRLHGFLATTQQANADLTALARTVANIPKDMLTGDQLDAAIAVLDNADAAIEKVMDIGGGAAAAAQGALQTVDDNNKNMHKIKPIDPEEKKQLELSLKGGGEGEAKAESIDYETSYKYLLEQYIAEADPAQQELPLDNPNTAGAKIKKGLGNLASKVGGAVKGAAGKAAAGVKQAAKDIGNKVTANKLNKAWKAAGEPTDAGSISNILADAGMTNDDISALAQEKKVDLPASATAPKADAGADAGAPEGGTAPAGGGETDGGATAQAGDTDTKAGADGGATAQAGDTDTKAGADGGSNADTASTSSGQSGGATATASKGERRATKDEIAKWVRKDAKLVDPKNPALDGAIEPDRDGRNIGLVRQADGVDHIWVGQSWTNMTTGKPVSADTPGLGRPDLEELAKEIKKANVAKLVKDQLTSPGVKAGTKQAQVTKQMTSKAATNAPAPGGAKAGTKYQDTSKQGATIQ